MNNRWNGRGRTASHIHNEASIMSVKLVAVWMFFSYATGYPQSFNGGYPEEIADSIGYLTRHIVEKYFSDSYCVGIVVENGQILKHILTFTPTVAVAVSTKPRTIDSDESETTQEETEVFDTTLVKLLDQGCSSFIIQVNNPHLLVEYFYKTSRKSVSRSNKRYVYLPSVLRPQTLSYSVPGIFRMKEMAVMPDLVVAKLIMKDGNCRNKNVVPDTDGIYRGRNSSISQHKPFTCRPDSCPSVAQRRRTEGTERSKDSCPNWYKIDVVTHRFVGSNPGTEVWLDTWTPRKGFLEDNDLYPNKMRNLHGKRVPVAAVPNYPPYTIIDTKSTPPVYDGIELRFVKDFARYLNFTFHVVTDEAGLWGKIWPNGTGNGMWGNVAMDFAVMGFGATYAWLENYPYLDYSLPYFRSSVRCLTPHPQKLPGWMSPLLPFSPNMWAAVGISLLITSSSLYLVTRTIMSLLGPTNQLHQRFSTVADSAISSVGLLLLQVPDEERSPEYVPQRHLLAWLMVFFLLINTIYSGGLASVLTVPRFEHPINSVADLARSNMLWAATTEAWVFSIQEAAQPDLQQITRNFRVMTDEQLLPHAFAGDLAFAVERLLGGNFALPLFVNEMTVQNLRAMRDDLYSGHCVFNVRKASPFLESLNTLILRLHAAGLLLNYEGQVVRTFSSQRMQLILAQNDQPTSGSGPVTLQIQHVQGPLFFLGFGLLVASLVFIMEHFKSKIHAT